MSERIAPYVGCPATASCGSDRSPATINWVSPSGRRVRIVPANYRIVSGNVADGSAVYECWPSGEVFPPEAGAEYSLRKNGRWRPVGDKGNSGYGLGIGFYDRYYDPHF